MTNPTKELINLSGSIKMMINVDYTDACHILIELANTGFMVRVGLNGHHAFYKSNWYFIGLK